MPRRRRRLCSTLRDLAHGVQNRGVVTTAEVPTNLQQRSNGQQLDEIHCNVPSPHDVGTTAARRKLVEVQIEEHGGKKLDVRHIRLVAIKQPLQLFNRFDNAGLALALTLEVALALRFFHAKASCV
jgi:hypothetical protein